MEASFEEKKLSANIDTHSSVRIDTYRKVLSVNIATDWNAFLVFSKCRN